MKRSDYANRDDLMQGLARVLEQDLADALEQQAQVCLAVPGGTTPGPLFDILSQAALDWARVHVILTDERWVPQNDPQSNAALIQARLLTGPAAAATFTPYYTDATDIDAAAAALSDGLNKHLPIDVLLLGMGADMHTASLFPDADGLEAAMAPDAPMFLPVRAAGQSAVRFSLAAPALRSARRTHLLITGDEKRVALSRAATLPPLEAPVGVILDNATVHWSAQ